MTVFRISQPTLLTLHLACGVGLLLWALVVWLALSQPWIGIELSSGDNGGWRIESIAEASDLDQRWVGAAIESLSPSQNIGAAISARAIDLTRQPDTLPTYALFNEFLERQAAIHQIKSSGSAVLTFTGGERAIVSIAANRPIDSLPIDVWLLALCGFSAWMTGVSLCVFRTQYAIGGWLLFAAGGGYFLLSMSHALYSNREISLAPEIIGLLNHLTYFGALTFALAGVCLALILPHMLIGKKVWIAALCVIAFWTNNYFQFIEWPIHSFLFPFIATFTVSVPLVIYQYRVSRAWASRHREFRWLIIGMVGPLVVANALYGGPVVQGAAPLIGDTFFIVLLSGLLVGAVVMVVRFDLFCVRSWHKLASSYWLTAVLIFPLVAFTVDSFIEAGVSSVLFVSVSTLSALFFAIPVGLRWNRNSPTEALQAIPGDVSDSSAESTWHRYLQQRFSPLHCTTHDHYCEFGVEQHGLVFHAPRLDANGHYRLGGKLRARDVFSSRDLEEASGISQMIQGLSRSSQDSHLAVQTERQRILRDLHDDVAPQLMAIVHKSEAAPVVDHAREALRNLRDTIYSLDDQNRFTVADVLLRIEGDVRQSLSAANIHLDCRVTGADKEYIVAPMKMRNLARVVAELTANVSRHSGANNTLLKLAFNAGEIALVLSDDGPQGKPMEWELGVGIRSVIRRVEEASGDIQWHSNPNEWCSFPCGTTAQMRLPL
ncbi:MAG: histidine kinase [Pseudomonadota bacterium]